MTTRDLIAELDAFLADGRRHLFAQRLYKEWPRISAELKAARAVCDWAEGAGDACWCQQENWRTETHLGKALETWRRVEEGGGE